MLLRLKNKEYLIVDEFKFKCSIGKKGLKSKKKEGDNCTPIGVFKIGKVYYRPDRVKKLNTILKTRQKPLSLHEQQTHDCVDLS